MQFHSVLNHSSSLTPDYASVVLVLNHNIQDLPGSKLSNVLCSHLTSLERDEKVEH